MNPFSYVCHGRKGKMVKGERPALGKLKFFGGLNPGARRTGERCRTGVGAPWTQDFVQHSGRGMPLLSCHLYCGGRPKAVCS